MHMREQGAARVGARVVRGHRSRPVFTTAGYQAGSPHTLPGQHRLRPDQRQQACIEDVVGGLCVFQAASIV